MHRFGKWTSQADNHIAGVLRSHNIPMKKRTRGLNLESDEEFTPYFQTHVQIAFPSSWYDDEVLPATNSKINGFTIEDRTLTREGGILDVVDSGIPCFFIKINSSYKRVSCINGEYVAERYRGGNVVEMLTMMNRSIKEFFTVIEQNRMVTGYDNVIKFIKDCLKGRPHQPPKAKVNDTLKMLKDHFDGLKA